MADGVEINPHIAEYTRKGVYLQLESTVPMVKDYQGTVDEAIDHLGLRNFVENQIEVIASERSYVAFMSSILNEETFNGKYSHLTGANDELVHNVAE